MEAGKGLSPIRPAGSLAFDDGIRKRGERGEKDYVDRLIEE